MYTRRGLDFSLRLHTTKQEEEGLVATWLGFEREAARQVLNMDENFYEFFIFLWSLISK